MRYPSHLKVQSTAAGGRPAFIQKNKEELLQAFRQAGESGVDLLISSELSLCGYSCGDLLHQNLLLESCEEALLELAQESHRYPWLAFLVGAPLRWNHYLFNTAVLLQNGKILGAVPKSVLPNQHEFYEQRWFDRAEVLQEQQVEILLQPSGLNSFRAQKFPLGLQIFELPLPIPSDQPNSVSEEIPHWAFHAPGLPSYKLGVEICEDLWSPNPPSVRWALEGALVLANLSASPALVSKAAYRKNLVLQQSARLHCAYLYNSSDAKESGTDLLFSGHQLLCCNGKLLAEFNPLQESSISSGLNDSEPTSPASCTALIALDELLHDRLQNEGFSKPGRTPAPCLQAVRPKTKAPDQGAYPHVFQMPFLPHHKEEAERLEEILQIQAQALARRVRHIHAQKLVLGISGGLDSTLALIVCKRCQSILNWSSNHILAITLPGFGTSDRTYRNACTLVQSLGAELREISIVPAVLQHFQDIGQDPSCKDTTYENAQARERTQILMDLANREQGLLVGTGDLSELALGWCTYNGDHMSMYGVNASVPKTLVSHLLRYEARLASARGQKVCADILEDILATPISPELLPPDEHGAIVQITEDTTGPYVLHDFFLYQSLRWGRSPRWVFFLACQAFAKSETNEPSEKSEGSFPHASNHHGNMQKEEALFTPEEILYWLKQFYKRFFSQQFKRSCLPDGPKIGSVSLSPRGDWRMPSDAYPAVWLAEVEAIEKSFT